MNKKKTSIYLEPGVSEQEYKSIQKEWYSKLKQEGFEDIETFDHKGIPHDMMKKDFYIDIAKNPEQYAAKTEYYRLAGQFLNDYKFNTLLDRNIWFAHSEGQSIREIPAFLDTTPPLTKDIVHRALKRLKVEFEKYVLTINSINRDTPKNK